jgi:hypothetical protein
VDFIKQDPSAEQVSDVKVHIPFIKNPPELNVYHPKFCS